MNSGESWWGDKWIRCPGCGFRVWLTKRGKMCKHIATASNIHTHDPFALLSSGVGQSVPRCSGKPAQETMP